MSRIKSSGSVLEQGVEDLLRRLRFRFETQVGQLPGKPDFVLTRRTVAIFVHGCFWHAHSCRRGQSTPSTRREFWIAKKAANIARDRREQAALRRLGYRVLVLWECELRDTAAVKARIRQAARKPRV